MLIFALNFLTLGPNWKRESFFAYQRTEPTKLIKTLLWGAQYLLTMFALKIESICMLAEKLKYSQSWTKTAYHILIRSILIKILSLHYTELLQYQENLLDQDLMHSKRSAKKLVKLLSASVLAILYGNKR